MGGEGGAPKTVKALVLVITPTGVVTVTSLKPGEAAMPIEMLTVNWVRLSTVKSLTVTPEPKLTADVSLRFVPVIVIPRLCPCNA